MAFKMWDNRSSWRKLADRWREVSVHFLAGVAVGCLGLFVVGVFASTILELFFG